MATSVSMVGVTAQVPSELKAAINEYANVKDVNFSDAMRELLASAVGFDLSPFNNAREAARKAREVEKAKAKVARERKASEKKLVSASINEMLKTMSFEEIAKRLGITQVA